MESYSTRVSERSLTSSYSRLSQMSSFVTSKFKRRDKQLPPRVYQLNKDSNHMLSNYVCTTKYNFLSFVPVCVLNQFKRLVNCYFLAVTGLQFIPMISPLEPWSGCMPLLTLLAFSMLREGIEDWVRYKSDKATNSRPVSVYKNGVFAQIRSDAIEVGDIVLIKANEEFPADLILMSSSNPDGSCFISTSSLDGEKNLKKRKQAKGMNKFISNAMINEDEFIFVGEVLSQHPSKDLYNFAGTLTISGSVIPLDINQMLLRSSQLRDTEWVVGFCAFTGHDTRIMQNQNKDQLKMSNLEKQFNSIAVQIITIQCILCASIILMSSFWNKEGSFNTNLYIPIEFTWSTDMIILFFCYFFLLNTMLPISIIFSFEVVKLYQAALVAWDTDIYETKYGHSARVNNCQLMEELGQIHYLFTDKTGTLTRNEMKMKAIIVGQNVYGDISQPGFKIQEQFMSSDCSYSEHHSKNVYDWPQEVLNYESLKLLALAHECLPEVTPSGCVYRGSSPDEVTLVSFADSVGFSNICHQDKISVLTIMGQELTFEVIRKMEFSSDRKMMSILVKDPQDGLVKLYVKGADEVILQRMANTQNKSTVEHTESFVKESSVLGLRTLLIGMKIVSDAELNAFTSACKLAEDSIHNRDQKLLQVYSELEMGIVLLGATALEDRLQDQVPQTIKDLQLAGIKIWMLTGDKFETAENVGISCKLIQQHFIFYRIQNAEDVQIICSAETAAQNERSKEEGLPRAMIVDGSMLPSILSELRLKNHFIDIAKTCDAVICCRVSPSQKAEVVKLIKIDDDQLITAAIGDGENDVSMIKEAHIGIGLYGHEGLRAVQSSDFAIGEFRFLWKLLLTHGRKAYRNNSELILYFLYKNLAMTIPEYYFAFVNGFSGQPIFADWNISFFNSIFTILPLMFRACYDHDTSTKQDGAATRQCIPHLYSSGPMRRYFNNSAYIRNFLLGSYHAAVVYFVPFYTYFETGIIDHEGKIGDLWAMSLCSYSVLIVIVSFNILLNSRQFTVLTLVGVGGSSIVLYGVWMYISDGYIPQTQNTMAQSSTSPVFYLAFLVSVVICFIGDYLFRSIAYLIWPTPSEYLQYLESNQISIDDENSRTVFQELCSKQLQSQSEQDALRAGFIMNKRFELIKMFDQSRVAPSTTEMARRSQIFEPEDSKTTIKPQQNSLSPLRKGRDSLSPLKPFI